MAIYYPQNSSDLAAIVTSAGDTVLLRSGVIYSAASVPAGLLSPSNVTIGVTGTGDKPVISGGVERSDWTFDAVNNVYSRPVYGSNILGNVTEDGIPMKHVPWNTNIATTAAAMNAGKSGVYWAGSMTFDTATNTLYIRPSEGAASAHKYVVSESIYGFNNVSTSVNPVVDGIAFRSISHHGIRFINKRYAKLSNLDFQVIGGGRPGSLYLGNGIELSAGTNGAETTSCTFSDIFDSPVTTQLYESTPQILSDHLWKDLTMARYGLTGVEISCQTTGYQIIRDIEITNIVSEDNGSVCWSGDRNGAVIANLTQGGTSRVSHCFASNIKGTNQRRLYLSVRTGGVNGIQDAVGVGSYFEGPRSEQLTGLYEQTDLRKNVVDNRAYVGTSWVDVTGDISKNFYGL
jgi:hypothetical protein